MSEWRSAPTGVITFLFTDVAGSTVRWERHPEAMRMALARHDQLVRTSLESRGGVIFTTAGDQFCAAFTIPADAVAAAVDAQIALQNEEWGVLAPFAVRMAITTGEAEAREGDYFGPPLNRCARLLAIAHGGQILLAEATTRLVPDSAEWSTKDLGLHSLRDLERAERVFQVLHPRLGDDFPPLRSDSDRARGGEFLADARQFLADERMRDAYQAYVEADRRLDLTSEDMSAFAQAAWWVGRIEESMQLREKAYKAFLQEQKYEKAALVAIDIAEDAHHRLARTVRDAWTRRAGELLEGAAESPVTGLMLRWRTVLALEVAGDRKEALALAEQVIDLGRRLGSRNVEALGLQDKGRILVADGRVAEGLEIMDQAMVAAVGGELDIDTTGRTYCNMLGICDQIADYRRAAEWNAAAEAWCEHQAESAYPGICRIYRAELSFLHGAWRKASEQTRQAAEELAGMRAIGAAAAYQLGEIALRSGELDEAEGWFRSAHESGHNPLPGLAQLRLALGEVDAAHELLMAALERSASDPFARAKLLPTWIEVLIARGELAAAANSVTELTHAGRLSGSSFIAATGQHWSAALALAEGRPADAIRDLEPAIAVWTELEMPFETARSRLLLARALSESGAHAASSLEFESARKTLERLGAPSPGSLR